MARKNDSNPLLDEFFSALIPAKTVYEFWEAHQAELQVCFPADCRNTLKMQLRAEDHTASAAPCIATQGCCRGYLVKDFGTGENVNPYQRLISLGHSKKNAMEKILSWLGEQTDTDRQKYQFEAQKMQKDVWIPKPYRPEVVRHFVSNRVTYEDRFNKVFDGFLRACSKEERLNFLNSNALLIGFAIPDQYNDMDRVVLFEQDANQVPWGHYKYNREAENILPGASKGKLRSKAKRVLLGSHLIRLFGKDVIYAEGHTDFVNNIAKNLACVTSGSANTPIPEEGLKALAGKRLHDFPDADDAGIKGALSRHLQIAMWNKNVPQEQRIEHIMYAWGTSIKTRKGSVMDKAAIEAFQRKELGKICVNLFGKTLKIPNNSPYLIRNWKGGDKNSLRKWGYDFVDFHIENQGKPRYHEFLSQFKFEL